MTEKLNINITSSDAEKYELLLSQIDSLISINDPIISNLSNFTSILKEIFPKISWVGFYLLKNDSLFLGPFQGKTACSIIKIGSGVCGTSASKKETIIVKDVHEFPDHIACDSSSNSEIVVPIVNNGSLFGVLDLDSYEFSAFGEIDKLYLEKLCKILASKFDLSKFIIS